MRIQEALKKKEITLEKDVTYTRDDILVIAEDLKPAFVRHRGIESISDAEKTRQQPLESRIPEALDNETALDLHFDDAPYRGFIAFDYYKRPRRSKGQSLPSGYYFEDITNYQ